MVAKDEGPDFFDFEDLELLDLLPELPSPLPTTPSLLESLLSFEEEAPPPVAPNGLEPPVWGGFHSEGGGGNKLGLVVVGIGATP